MSDQTPRDLPIDPDRLHAIEVLKAVLDQDTPVEFHARLEQKREFYWVTVHSRIEGVYFTDISLLVANALGFTLIDGRFRESILEIMDRLVLIGVNLTNFRIIEKEDL